MVSYQDRDNFCVALKSKNDKDLLIIVKSSQHVSLEDALSHCN
jgi:hypothetical protein